MAGIKIEVYFKFCLDFVQKFLDQLTQFLQENIKYIKYS